MTESNAILRHIGRRNGLTGKTEEEKVKVDMLQNLSYNFHVDFARICFSPDYVSRPFLIILARYFTKAIPIATYFDASSSS